MRGSAPDWLQRSADGGLGCYVHIPFCDRICPYCDFAVALYRDAPMRRYMTALLREIDEVGPHAGASSPRPLQTLYLGGGTPSALPRAALEALLRAIFERYETRPGSIECTLEANPARNVGDLPAWREAGINRLSVGVQSLDDADLHRLGRAHTRDQAVEFCVAAREAGFSNVSIDLIAGAPGQDEASFERTLAEAIALGVDHISIYGLTIEAGTPYATWYGRDPSAFPDDDALASMLDTAHGVLSDAGFVHYEISNFARPGFESAHNVGYWRQRDCVAFGVSAAGYESGMRYRNQRDFEAYCVAIESGQQPRVDEERLEPWARLGEAAMLALRTSVGMEYDDFRKRFGVPITIVYATAAEKCMAAGLLEQDARGMRLTRRGRLLANTVCAEFLVPQPLPVVTR
jgi:putative oxygen-independent coproporphyrinogen III oxidase